MMSTVKRRSCIAFALVLLFMCVAVPIQADAIAGIDDALAIIAASLGAFGIGLTVTGTWASVHDFLEDKVEDFCSSIGTTVTDWLAGWGSVAMARDGKLVAGVAAAAALASFARWLVTELSLQDNATQLVSTTSLYLMQDGTQFTWGRIDDSHTVILYLGTIFQIGVTYALANGCEFDVSRAGTGNAFQFHRTKAGIGSSGTAMYSMDGPGPNANFNYYCFVSNYSGGYPDDGTSTNPVLCVLLDDNGNAWDWQTGRVTHFGHSAKQMFGDPSSEQLAVTTGVIDVPTTGELTDAGLVVGLDLPAGTTLSQAIPAIQTGIVAGTLNPTAEIVGEATLPETLPDLGSAGDYEVPGLHQVFPFCIPFDLYEAFAVLAAEPVAPSFEVPFEIPGVVDYTFEIDLSEFDTVAAVLRTMELLLFIVGLILITRRLIRG